MRNLGIYFPTALGAADLAEFGLSLGGLAIDESTQRFGEIPEAAYLDLATDLSNGCFDDDELEQLTVQLGFAPAAYLSIHMSSTQAALGRALSIAESISGRWGGRIDYSGAGASLEKRFQPPDSVRKRPAHSGNQAESTGSRGSV